MDKVMNTTVKTNQGSTLKDAILSYLPVLILLFFFLIGVQALSSSFKMMGSGFTKALLENTMNPFISLMSGMLATIAVQSSSVTTSVIVGMVSAGTLTVQGAIPMIMGANLGTSITNTLVSLGYVNNKKNFAKAFSAGTIHDCFNILGVIIVLPLELSTGLLSKSATYISSIIYGASSSVKFKSPIKAAIKPVVKSLQAFVTDVLGFQGNLAGIAMLILSGIIIVVSLGFIVKVTKGIVENSKGEILEKLLSKNALTTILFGTVLTFAVQSSSITTSLLVPLAASGMLSLEAIFPVTVGANIGTTTTALLASLTGNVHGLTIAIVHFLFNILTMLIWFVPRSLRQVPLSMSKYLAKKCEEKRRFGFIYIVTVFLLIPVTFSVLYPYFLK